jgi:hypothetical protein
MDLIFLFIILILGIIFIYNFKNKISENNFKVLKYLSLYHLLFGLFFSYFITAGDAVNYWKEAKALDYDSFLHSIINGQGTAFMNAINYYPANVLNLSYLSGTLLFTFIGFIGLTYFYINAIKLVPNNPKFLGINLFPLLFFLPNLHFWSCSIGKDTLMFTSIAFVMHGLLKPVKRLPLLIVALTLTFLIRPHITLFLLLAFGIAYFSGKNISFIKRILFFCALIGLAIIILPVVLKFTKIEEASLSSFDKFSVSKASVLSRATTNSSLNISSYPFPLKIFTFLFRPFFFDVNSIPSLLAAFENFILLILTLSILRNKPVASFRSAPFIIQGIVYFLIIGTLAFSQSLGNLGIIVRMKNMFLPGFIIFIFWHFSYQKSKEI